MNIKFKSIHLNNFLSFSDATIQLNRNNYVLVRGENSNPVDNATSNGSGKSAIFDAITWCLTGDTLRGSKNVSNIYGDNGAMVDLQLSVDSNDYQIVRYKEHKPEGTTLKIYVNGEDKSGKGIRDTEALLSEYLPELTTSLLSSVIILGQGLPQRFSNNTPSGRKEVLEKLSKSDFMIDDIKARVNNRKLKLNSDISERNNKSIEYNSKKSMLEAEKLRLEAQLSTFSDEECIRNQERKLIEHLAQYNEEERSLNEKLLSAQEIVSRMDEEIKQLDLDHLNDECRIKDSYNYDINICNSNISALKAELSSLQKEIYTLDSITDVCPTCGQKLVNVIKPDTTNLKEELANLNDKLASEQENLGQINTKLSSALHECSIKYKEQRGTKEQVLKSSKEQLATVAGNYDNLTKDINKTQLEIDKLRNQIDMITHNKETVKGRVSEIDDDLIKLSQDILYNNNEKENLEAHASVINKLNTIVTRDFRGVLLANVIEYISKQAKFYSKQVFDNDNIGFCSSGNAIEISFDGKDYSNLSGGERQKVDVIIQLSLRDMLCKFLNFSSNIIVLDELFDNLDSTGCERVLSLVAKNLTDVETVYIITHHAEISIPTDDEIVIVKGSNKLSTVR